MPPTRIDIKTGTVFTIGGQNWLALKVGRGLVRSVFAMNMQNETKVFTEADFNFSRWGYVVISNKKKNVEYAREYCKNNLVPDV